MSKIVLVRWFVVESVDEGEEGLHVLLSDVDPVGVIG